MKREDKPITRLYAYGCLPPSKAADVVDGQIRLAHEYRNKLVELEQYRRARFREIIGGDSRVATASAEVQRRRDRIALLEDAVARATVDRSEEHADTARAEVKALRGELRGLVKEYRVVREAALRNEDTRCALAVLRDDVNARWRAARAASGLYWGTYLIVERAIDRARMGTMDPRFRRWTGRGSIGVRVTSTAGLTFDELTNGKSSTLQFDPVDRNAWRTRASRRSVRPVVRFRVGTQDDGSPLWAEFVVCMHRPLPPNATVKWARVVKEREGPRVRYSLLLTVSAMTFVRAVPRRTPRHRAALHLAWRTMPEGDLRVGYLADDRGVGVDLRLPRALTSALEHADSLRSIRDQIFEELRHELVAELTRLELPTWLQDVSRSLPEWRSQETFEPFVFRWANSRFRGDRRAFDAAEAWRRQQRHLWQWEANERARARRRRFEIYRSWARDWSSKYRLVRLEDYDLRALSRVDPLTGREGPTMPAVQRNRVRASPHELRAAVAGKVNVEYVSAALTAQSCHVCGVVGRYNSERTLVHTCIACGQTWDVHLNAARNLLRLRSRTRAKSSRSS